MVQGRGARVNAAIGRTLGRLSSGDRVAVALLVALPVVLVVPYSLAGHPLIPGDDLAQNYPLRVLAGADLRSGHLPTWDPFIWSGTPLLASWNAGALYPGTLLFAVLPGVAAWTVNLVAVPVVAGTGMYVLLRRLCCRPLGAVIGALVFSDTGFMSGQVVHIGLVQGTGFLPWTLVAVEVLATSTLRRERGCAVILLGVALALCVLAGEPRAVSSEVVVLMIYVAALLVRAVPGRRVGVVAGSVAGVAVAGGLSAIQWVPGLSFVSSSQRGLGGYAAFGAGSLELKTVAHFMLVPFLVGGNGNFGLPLFRASYNLAEETIGVGLLPLCAALVYLPDLLFRPVSYLSRLVRRITRFTGRAEERRGGRRIGVWYVIGLVGLLLTMGEATPLGRVLVHIPLYGAERLQNRNAVMFDLALAVLGAFFVDDLTAVPRPGARPAGPSADPLASRPRRLLMLVAPGATVALIAAAYLHPLGVQHAFAVATPLPSLYDRLTPYLVVTLCLAVAIGLFAFAVPRLVPRVRSLLLAPLAFVDVGLYVANASYATAPSAVLAGATPVSARLAALTGSAGRFAIYNPLVSLLPNWPRYVDSLGETDLDILRGVPSVQGYGSIVGGAYQDATSTHDFEDLDSAALGNGLFDTLDLRVLLTLPEYLEEVIPDHSAIPVAGASPVTAGGRVVAASDAPAPPLLASGPWTVPTAGSAEWRLAEASTVVRITVVVNATSGRRPPSIGVGVAAERGPAHLVTADLIGGQAHVDLAVATKATGIVVANRSGSPITVGAVVAVTENPDLRLVLDGALQGELAPAHWADAGVLGPFSVFVTKDPVAAAWLQGVGSSTADDRERAPGSVSISESVSSGAMVVFAPAPSVLVRSETYQSGWRATITPIGGGRPETVPVGRLGLVQEIRVPKGRYQVSFAYEPRSLLVGLFITAASLAAVVVLLAAALVSARRRGVVPAAGGSRGPSERRR